MLLFTTCAFAQNNPTIEDVKKLTKGGNYADANYKVTVPYTLEEVISKLSQ